LPLQQAKNRTDAASKASREQRLEKRGQKDKKFTTPTIISQALFYSRIFYFCCGFCGGTGGEIGK